jgi:cell division protein FtsQ
MDGGGRLLRSVSGQGAAGLAAPAFAGAGAAPIRALVPSGSRALARRKPVVRASERIQYRVPKFTGTYLVIALFGAVGLYGAVRGGGYADFLAFQGEPRNLMARALGMGIETVTISGLVELDQTEVLQVAGIDPRGSLPFFDAATARDRLLAMPMIREATVRKLYPGTLDITVVEREPFALWQNHGDVFVVSADGTVIDTLNDSRFNRLPQVVGEGANARAVAFTKLMDAAPDVRAHVRAGLLVGGRRWTLKMDNGVDVRLPELGAPQAVARLAGLIREQKILEKDVLSIDLRMPDRVVLRLTEDAAAARADANKGKPKGGKGSVI